jgi:hypothetical protein
MVRDVARWFGTLLDGSGRCSMVRDVARWFGTLLDGSGRCSMVRDVARQLICYFFFFLMEKRNNNERENIMATGLLSNPHIVWNPHNNLVSNHSVTGDSAAANLPNGNT